MDFGGRGTIKGYTGFAKPAQKYGIIIGFDGIVGSYIRQILTPLAQLGQ
jgi:hypothetical protein